MRSMANGLILSNRVQGHSYGRFYKQGYVTLIIGSHY